MPEAPVSNLLAGVAEQSDSIVCRPPEVPGTITVSSTPGSIPSIPLSGEEPEPALSVSIEMPVPNRGVDAPPVLDELFSQVTNATPDIVSPTEPSEPIVRPPPIPTVVPPEDIGVSSTTTPTRITVRPVATITPPTFRMPTIVPGLTRFVVAPTRIIIPLVPFIRPRPLPIPTPKYLTYKPLNISLIR